MPNFISQCKSFAVNLKHQQITEDDITKGFNAYSSDMLTDLNLEIRDIYPNHENILAAFYLSKKNLQEVELKSILDEHLGSNLYSSAIIETLLWYGFLGIYNSEENISYIYNVNYNMDLLKTMIKKAGTDIIFHINPAFWPSLHIIN